MKETPRSTPSQINRSYTAQFPYRPIYPHHSTYSEFYKERAFRPSKDHLSIERSERFPDYLLVRILWQRRRLKHPFSITSLPTISSTSPCRLQPIYYSCVSATIRLSKILVYTPSLAPLPQTRGPGHIQLHLHRSGPAQCSMEGNEFPARPNSTTDLAPRPTHLAAWISTSTVSRLRLTAPFPVYPEWNDIQNNSRDSGTFVLSNRKIAFACRAL